MPGLHLKSLVRLMPPVQPWSADHREESSALIANAAEWPTVGNRPSATREDDDVPVGIRSASERFQEFNQVGFLCRCKIQCEQLVIVIDHCQEIRRTAIVKIRGMLPESS